MHRLVCVLLIRNPPILRHHVMSDVTPLSYREHSNRKQMLVSARVSCGQQSSTVAVRGACIYNVCNGESNMSGKRKPSPESPLVSLSPDSLLLASPPLFTDDDENVSDTSFIKANQQKNKELAKSAKLQKPQKQKSLLSSRSKTFDSSIDNSDYENVQSPGGASNASSDGPVYVRKPGFEHHAQEFEVQKSRQGIKKEDEDIRPSRSSSKTPLASKKKKSLVQGTSDAKDDVGVIRKTDPSSSKLKPKKGNYTQTIQ